jgi:hypothetical protein
MKKRPTPRAEYFAKRDKTNLYYHRNINYSIYIYIPIEASLLENRNIKLNPACANSKGFTIESENHSLPMTKFSAYVEKNSTRAHKKE